MQCREVCWVKQSQLVEGIANRDSFATRWSIARVLHRNKAVLSNPAKREKDFAALAETAVEKGDLQSAKRWLVQAVGAEPRNPRHRYLLGIVLEALGDRGGAAQALTVALRLDERHADAARRLGELLARGRLPPRTRLDRQGLVAALGHNRIDRDLVAAAALKHIVEDGELGGILARAACEGWETTARGLVMRRTSPTLDDALLRAVLTASPIARLDVERLLISVRRVALLELPVSRFADPVLLRFLAVLAAQTALNEYVWAEGDDEESAIDTLLGQASPSAVEHGNRSVDDHDNARRLALLALYRPVEAFAPCDTRVAGAAEAIAHVLNAQLELQRTIAERARLVRSLGTFGHETTRLVAAQYEAAPYPRWTSAHVAKQGVFLRETKARLGAARLAFTERPFEVLVAGCGTGKQAVTAALDWGTNARVTGVDISRASLAWASAMAERFGVSNLDLAHADVSLRWAPPCGEAGVREVSALIRGGAGCGCVHKSDHGHECGATAQQALAGGAEARDRGGDAAAGRVGLDRGAPVQCEREPGVQLASSVRRGERARCGASLFRLGAGGDRARAG
jgi:hypothetical protein